MNKKSSVKIETLEKYNKEIYDIVLFHNKGIYKLVQAFILENEGNIPSVGLICAYFKKHDVKEITPRLSYGSGDSVKVGRTSKDKYVDKTGNTFYRTKNNIWVAEYILLANGAPYSDDDRDSELVVHHLNGNHQDNTLSNLVLITDTEHKSLHMKNLWKNNRDKIYAGQQKYRRNLKMLKALKKISENNK